MLGRKASGWLDESGKDETQKSSAGGGDIRNRQVGGSTASPPSVFCPRPALFMQDRKGIRGRR